MNRSIWVTLVVATFCFRGSGMEKDRLLPHAQTLGKPIEEIIKWPASKIFTQLILPSTHETAQD